jgi:hypothetical protein
MRKNDSNGNNSTYDIQIKSQALKNQNNFSTCMLNFILIKLIKKIVKC